MKTVLLIHGIRTQAWWQGSVAAILAREADCRVVPIKYGYFDLLHFWLPFNSTRQGPIHRIHREIRNVLDRHPDDKLYIIAHSYGTYAVAQILSEFQDITLDGLIFCGSIVPVDFHWSRISTQINATDPREVTINECGTRDFWPPLASSTSWGYGASGTYGFGAADVQDRIHRASHSAYFQESFVKQFWVPFITTLTAIPSETQTRGEGTPKYFWIFNFPLKWLIAAVLVAIPVGATTYLLDRAFSQAHIGVGEFACAADNMPLKNCSVTKLGPERILSFDGPDARSGDLIDRYSGSITISGKDVIIRLSNQFNTNPRESAVTQDGPSSQLRLSESAGNYIGVWTFRGDLSYRFSMAKKVGGK